jgi:hypothetical protein
MDTEPLDPMHKHLTVVLMNIGFLILRAICTCFLIDAVVMIISSISSAAAFAYNVITFPFREDREVQISQF